MKKNILEYEIINKWKIIELLGTKLKYIDVAFTGVDHVDLEAACAKGIQVSNAAGSDRMVHGIHGRRWKRQSSE